MSLNIKLLSTSHIEASLRLSTLAGWNQLEADWLRLIRLWPATCLAGIVDEQLVATATLAIHGDVGWVGMVLVDPKYQKQGYGRAMLDEIISAAKCSEVKTLGLDATDQGRPIYRKLGFHDQARIDRWRSPGQRIGVRHPRTSRSCGPEDWPDLLGLDFSATGLNRQPLLTKLATEAGAVVRVIASPISAYGMARDGRTAMHIGPVIATSSDSAEIVLDNILDQIGVDAPVIIDVPRTSVLTPLLAVRGFAVIRELTRMRRPAANFAPSLSNAAAAGFEIG